jgi:transcription termination factor Rho
VALSAEFLMDDLKKLHMPQLRQLAKDMGLAAGKLRKDELIELIEASLIKIEPEEIAAKDKSLKKREEEITLPGGTEFDIINGKCSEKQKPKDDKKQSITTEGFLDVMADGYGFLRAEDSGKGDIYVPRNFIKRYNMKTGDIVSAQAREPIKDEKRPSVIFVNTINGAAPDLAKKRLSFEKMVPIFPDEKLKLEHENSTVAMRVMDIFCPIGKGQRGLIVSPPKAGKTTLLKDIAKSIKYNNLASTLIILLIGERPEEVTDIKDSVEGDNVQVVFSTFDEAPERHKIVAEQVIERAKRMVELKQDVVILLDSITRLTRAYNLTEPASGKTLSGGLDPAAFYMPKRFFGAARNMREGGSLTIIATALVDTGSRMDDLIYEEFKGTGNMELVLSRKLSERRVFPAIDLGKSGTRRDDLLLSRDELKAANIIRRRILSDGGDDATEAVLNIFNNTDTNRELVKKINGASK